MNLLGAIVKNLKKETSEGILKKLRDGGADIGKKVVIYTPDTVDIDDSRPYLLSIGDYTKITRGTVILTHDYSLSVLRRVYGEWIGEGAHTKIGKNCFIGANSIILMGAQLGDNVIVGAGSVVHGIIPDNVVIAGNPAKIICTLDEYHRKRTERTKKEAILCARRFYDVYGKLPNPSDLNGFKFLFTPRDERIVKDYGIVFQCTGDETSEVIEEFYKTDPIWKDFDDFLKDAGLK